MELNIRL